MDFDPKKMRKRFATLTERYDVIDADRTKLQLERDGKVADGSLTAKQEASYADKIRALHNQAAPIENERAMISRALGGATGMPE